MIFTSFSSGLDYPCATAQSKGWRILLPLSINLTTELWLFKVQFLYQLLFPAVAHLLLAFPKDKEQLCRARWIIRRWITRGWKAFPSSPRIHCAVVCFCGLKGAVHMQELPVSYVLLSSHIGQATDQTNQELIYKYLSLRLLVLSTKQRRKLKCRQITWQDQHHRTWTIKYLVERCV